ncbi:Rhodanese-related sulfurtransferase [Ignavibacterium album JCM 16511]|uniref:Rhodanese-related sulfurtransferase n=1 Tax=Ignavibacterium album (strain DSM 19864 / JCM 16511 / NBRC 101810 / Mat9-16) TaxID=945713 RepID=I0AGU0_IGNAJ|nr:rhodanese-like domain-containing protein [Ignavibacterium album]AFH48197.1 Rhodanese-related sulfurtransferase [Ignavibacterium album JCM 16511]
MKLSAFVILFITLTFKMFAQATSEVPSINVDEFIKLVEKDSSVIILDVRTPAELTGPLGKIQRAINIPIQELPGRINELKPYKDQQIYVICRTQNRSFASSQSLNKNGFKTVYVIGGMTEYFNKKNNNK